MADEGYMKWHNAMNKTHCLRCSLVGYPYPTATQSCLPSSVLSPSSGYASQELYSVYAMTRRRVRILNIS